MVHTRASLARTMEARVSAIEEKLEKIDDIEAKMGKLDQIDQLQEQIRLLVQATQRQNDDQRHRRGSGLGNGHNHEETHHKPTHFTKMEFPRFQGREVDSWISKCEHFFHLDGTVEAEKVTMASMGLDEASFAWHVASERRWRRPMGWNEYVVLLRDTYGLPIDKPMGELSRLRQTGNLTEFNTKFDLLSAKLDLTEEYLIDIYLTVLNEEISHTVLLFDPKTLGEARRLAKIEEMSINHKEATHDFMDYNLAVKLGWKPSATPLVMVQVAGGQKLQIFDVWHGFRWNMQGLEFIGDLKIVQLNTCDVILGLTWLKTIKKSALWDFGELSMKFWYKGKVCELQSSPLDSLQVIPSFKLEVQQRTTNSDNDTAEMTAISAVSPMAAEVRRSFGRFVGSGLLQGVISLVKENLQWLIAWSFASFRKGYK